MNKAFITIMKKELKRFFGDKKIVFSAIILPGLLIYLMYSIMGTAFNSDSDDAYEVPKCYVVNLPQEETLQAMLTPLFDFVETESSEIDTIKARVEEKESVLLAVFPEGFAQDVLAADTLDSVPQVCVYYNSSDTDSYSAYTIFCETLAQYEELLANRFDVNAGEAGEYDLAKEEDSTAELFAMMLPMLLTIFSFVGAMAVAPESIAGEKERGTIATLLVTPVRRSHIAVGKILALSVVAMLSGLSSTLGTVLSLPKLTGSDMNGSIYSAVDYLLLMLVILSTVVLYVVILSVVSAYAKSIKEATNYATPLMLLAVFVGLTAMMGDGAPEKLGFYAIPLYGSVQSMARIFQFCATPATVLLSVAVNLAVSFFGVFVLAKMFESEKIIFS